MIQKIINWIRGELIEGTIVRTGHGINYPAGQWAIDYTLVNLPNGERKFTKGCLGEPGDKIKINSWRLWNA